MTEKVISLLFSPSGLSLIVILAVMIGWSFTNRGIRWAFLSLILVSVTLARATEVDGGELTLTKTLASPLNEMCEHGRSIAMLMLICCTIVIITRNSKDSFRTPLSLMLFVSMHFLLIVKMMSSGMVEYAVISMIIQGLYFIVFSYGSHKLIDTKADLIWSIRAIGIAMAFFCIANLLQFVVNREPLFAGSRFMGTTANPQFAAVLLALGIPFVVYLISNRSLTALERCAWAALACIQALFIVLTGSRAGALMSTISICIAFRQKLGMLILLVPIIGFGMIQIAEYFSAEVDIEFLLRTEDTRSHMWDGLLWNFQNYPIFGAPQSGRLGFAENSWLSMASVCGFIGLIPMLGFGVAILFEAVALSRTCARDVTLQSLSHVIQAVVAVLILGSIFEAYLLGVYNFPVPLVYMLSIVIQSVRRIAMGQQVTDRSYGKF